MSHSLSNTSKSVRILGLMTGTSCDGVEGACLEFSGNDAHLIWTETAAMPENLRKQALALQRAPERSRYTDGRLFHRDFGEFVGKKVAQWLKKSEHDADVIAFHGQTIDHQPDRKGGGWTVQLGDPTRVAAHTSRTVIAQFRDGDLARGGQGAPLAPRFHGWMIRNAQLERRGAIVLNIGGVSNATILNPNGDVVSAWDLGPGNTLIDEATVLVTRGKRRFDRGGELAKKGAPDSAAAKRFLKHPYFRLGIPKSCHKGIFTLAGLRKGSRAKGGDLVATAAEASALAIVQELRRAQERDVFVCGGGAQNPFLMARLAALGSEFRFHTTAALGWDPQYVEASAFAYFGLLVLRGESITTGWTGSLGFSSPGSIVVGENWSALQKRITGS